MIKVSFDVFSFVAENLTCGMIISYSDSNIDHENEM